MNRFDTQNDHGTLRSITSNLLEPMVMEIKKILGNIHTQYGTKITNIPNKMKVNNNNRQI